MLVKINETLYEMERPAFLKMAEAVSPLILHGIYAVEKDGYAEMRNDKLHGAALQSSLKAWERDGFTVYYNV